MITLPRALALLLALLLPLSGLAAPATAAPRTAPAPALSDAGALQGRTVLLPLDGSAGAVTPSRARAALRAADAPTDVTPDAAWCWFGDPRAVRHRGAQDRTFLGWLTRTGEVQVGQYDHRTGQFTTATLMSGFPVDDHENPSLVVRPDGRLMVFWSGHVGPVMHYRVSSAPESIDAWDPVEDLPVQLPGMVGYTYPNPVFAPGEGDRLYLFWRAGSQPAVSWSDDLGGTWSPARQLVARAGGRPYVKVALAPNGTIGLAFTDAHPRETAVNDVHYAALRGGALHRSDGTLVARLADGPRPPDAFETVHAQSAWAGQRAWVHDLAFDSRSSPVVVLAAFPSASDHRYRYARRTASGWQVTEMVAAGPAFETSGLEVHYSGGITLDHEDPSVAYLSRRVGATWEVERWRTADGGTSWTVTPLTSGSTEPNVRPVSPRGSAGGALDVVWMAGGYAHYTSFSTGIDGAATTADRRPAPRLTGAAASARVAHGAPLAVRATLAGAAGSALSARALQLWHAPEQSPSVLVGTATTDRTGAASFRVPGRTTGAYEVRFTGDSRSAPASSVRLPVQVVPASTAVTVTTSDDEVAPGAPVRVTARLARTDDGRTVGGQPLVLQQRLPGEAVGTAVGTVRTDRTGTAAWDVVPGAPDTRYSVRAEPSTGYRAAVSAVATVRVRVPTTLPLQVGVTPGQPVVELRTVLRSAGGPLAGRLVTVEARWATTDRWTRIAAPRTGPDGAALVRHRPTAPTLYRVSFAGDAELAAAQTTSTVARGPRRAR